MRNPLKVDPSRTALLRRRMVADMNRRFAALRKSVVDLIVRDDIFGLQAPPKIILLADWQAWRFHTDDRKLAAFNAWFKDQTDRGILRIDGVTGDPWTAEYVRSAYKQGSLRAYLDSRQESVDENQDVLIGKQRQFLESAFTATEAVSKIRLLSMRTFEELKGITAAMGQKISRILADGLSQGRNPRVMAREIAASVDGINRTRARTLARTEIIHAHAEGQLDGFERLGVKEVGIMAEWSTAGDDLVCPLCQPLNGQIMTVKEARGKIPRHPNCRCAWIPVVKQRGGTAERQTGFAMDDEGGITLQPGTSKKILRPGIAAKHLRRHGGK